MKEKTNIQAAVLDTAQRTRAVVTVFFVNGFQMHGTIKGHDGSCILLESDGKQNLVYKHAVSTVTPLKTLDIRIGTSVTGAESES